MGNWSTTVIVTVIAVTVIVVCHVIKTFFSQQKWTMLRLIIWLLLLDQNLTNTAQKMKFSIKDFFSKCDQIRRNLRRNQALCWNPCIMSFLNLFVFSTLFIYFNWWGHWLEHLQNLFCLSVSFAGFRYNEFRKMEMSVKKQIMKLRWTFLFFQKIFIK